MTELLTTEKPVVSTAKLYAFIAGDLSIAPSSIVHTVALLEDKATVPFIARYRKERTGGLDEQEIRAIQEKWDYYKELEERKLFITHSITEQGKLTDSLQTKIEACRDKKILEDLYLPYKPKKRTKASIAKEKGLEPLSILIEGQVPSTASYDSLVLPFLNEEKGVLTIADAIAGALDIIVENINDHADIRTWIRDYLSKKARLTTAVRKEWKDTKTKYEMYYQFSELLQQSASHRLLAIRRGTQEGVLSWHLEIAPEPAIAFMEQLLLKKDVSPFTKDLRCAIGFAYKRIFISLEMEVFISAIHQAEREAITVFSKNAQTLLLDSPAGNKVIMGIDPGFRTGCKIAVIDGCGTFLEYVAIFPHPPQQEEEKARTGVCALLKKYAVQLIAIGNGTASRETTAFIRTCLPAHSSVRIVSVNEAGASVYSASEVAIREFPDLDVTVRGAISIARRLQDPLAELVKIDPKAIGVGQYQHDVNQIALKKSLDAVIESCVNYVGVEINTASEELLSYVAGIGPVLAHNIVSYRKENGSFKTRKKLLAVPKLGEKAFEQCAGFIRVRESSNCLDNSAIHPERYRLVETMAADLAIDIDALIGNDALIARIPLQKYVTPEVGLPTLTDIVHELKKPGLDPRSDFHALEFRDDVQEITDLREKMELTGKVTNVTNFGAFVDIGVHQDGLIHISKLSRSFVKDPHAIVSVGDTVRVRVLTIDCVLKRIGLERIE